VVLTPGPNGIIRIAPMGVVQVLWPHACKDFVGPNALEQAEEYRRAIKPVSGAWPFA
jgi:hypothetical protein